MDISVVVSSRNDDHGGGLVPRMNMFMLSLQESARRASIEIDLIIVEWNPPEGRAPLQEVLTFVTAPKFTTRVVTVPKAYHETLGNSDHFDFFQMLAKNVGVRRARYPWILSTNPDLFYGPSVFQGFVETGQDPNRYYRVPRTDVKSGKVPPGDYLCQFERIMLKEIVHHVRPWIDGMLTEACGDFHLVHRSVWDQVYGYPEWPIWSIHLDSLFQSQCFNRGIQQTVLQAGIYHLDHARSWVVNPEEIKQHPHIELELVSALHKFQKTTGVQLTFNDVNWGAADEEFNVYHADC